MARKVGKLGYRGANRVQTVNTEPSMTVQSDAHLADINQIMSRFAADGITSLDEADLMFKDVSEFTDLKDALDQAALAEVEFLKLPSKVREIFNHNVAEWLDTAHDSDKREALINAGFIKAPVEAVEEGIEGGVGGTAPGGAVEAVGEAE